MSTDPHVIYFDGPWRAFRARLLRDKRIASYREAIAEARAMETDTDPLIAAYGRQRRALYARWLQAEETER